jgi:hypothetical protein
VSKWPQKALHHARLEGSSTSFLIAYSFHTRLECFPALAYSTNRDGGPTPSDAFEKTKWLFTEWRISHGGLRTVGDTLPKQKGADGDNG